MLHRIGCLAAAPCPTGRRSAARKAFPSNQGGGWRTRKKPKPQRRWSKRRRPRANAPLAATHGATRGHGPRTPAPPRAARGSPGAVPPSRPGRAVPGAGRAAPRAAPRRPPLPSEAAPRPLPSPAGGTRGAPAPAAAGTAAAPGPPPPSPAIPRLPRRMRRRAGLAGSGREAGPGGRQSARLPPAAERRRGGAAGPLWALGPGSGGAAFPAQPPLADEWLASSSSPPSSVAVRVL